MSLVDVIFILIVENNCQIIKSPDCVKVKFKVFEKSKLTIVCEIFAKYFQGTMQIFIVCV